MDHFGVPTVVDPWLPLWTASWLEAENDVGGKGLGSRGLQRGAGRGGIERRDGMIGLGCLPHALGVREMQGPKGRVVLEHVDKGDVVGHFGLDPVRWARDGAERGGDRPGVVSLGTWPRLDDDMRTMLQSAWYFQLLQTARRTRSDSYGAEAKMVSMISG